jgi:hypothetical protein
MQLPLKKLLSISSAPIVAQTPSGEFLDSWGRLGVELGELLNEVNGFYAYESALLVRPMQNQSAPLGVVDWNAHNLWKVNYAEGLGKTLFFAEDIFGVQYCIRGDGICTFDPETGLFEAMRESLVEWSNDIMLNYNLRTGYALAHEWQTKNGILKPGIRLLPKIPFVCGGKYELDNLYPLDDVKGMLFRASIANQIRDLPDGSEIVIKPVQ